VPSRAAVRSPLESTPSRDVIKRGDVGEGHRHTSERSVRPDRSERIERTDRPERRQEQTVTPQSNPPASAITNQEQKRAETPSRAEAPRVVPANSTARLNDLRSVLRDIVARELPESEPTPDVKPKSGHAPDLKQTLATVLKQDLAPEVMKEESVSQAPVIAEVSPVVMARPAREQESSRPPLPPATTGITPQELERMMRVNPSDRPPL
jgi:hypothetical protein